MLTQALLIQILRTIEAACLFGATPQGGRSVDAWIANDKAFRAEVQKLVDKLTGAR